MGRPATHGLSHTRGYKCYRSALQRCYDPKHQAYSYYGGKGIKMCDAWRQDFTQFHRDMGGCPEGHTLEREDTTGDYEPGNCVWIPAKDQQRNRSSCVYFMLDGERITMREAAFRKGIAWQTVQTRLRAGDSKAHALRPVVSRNGK